MTSNAERLIDLNDQKFGRLRAIRKQGHKRGYAMWLCVCDCGGTTTVRSDSLRTGNTRSCGCLRREKSKESGKTLHKRRKWRSRGITTYGLYPMWESMILSCEDPTYLGYGDYGGAGIRVCKQWHDFKKFRKWARANGGRKGLLISRKDPDGDYEPSNCTFVTLGEALRRDFENHLEEVAESFGLGKYEEMLDLTNNGVNLDNLMSPDWMPDQEFWDQV